MEGQDAQQRDDAGVAVEEHEREGALEEDRSPRDRHDHRPPRRHQVRQHRPRAELLSVQRVVHGETVLPGFTSGLVQTTRHVDRAHLEREHDDRQIVGHDERPAPLTAVVVRELRVPRPPPGIEGPPAGRIGEEQGDHEHPVGVVALVAGPVVELDEAHPQHEVEGQDDARAPAEDDDDRQQRKSDHHRGEQRRHSHRPVEEGEQPDVREVALRFGDLAVPGRSHTEGVMPRAEVREDEAEPGEADEDPRHRQPVGRVVPPGEHLLEPVPPLRELRPHQGRHRDQPEFRSRITRRGGRAGPLVRDLGVTIVPAGRVVTVHRRTSLRPRRRSTS